MGAKLSSQHGHTVVPLFMKSKQNLKLPVIPEYHAAPSDTKNKNLEFSVTSVHVLDITDSDVDCLQLENYDDVEQSEFMEASKSGSARISP